MTTQTIDNWLQFSAVAFGVLVVISELAGWPGSTTLAFGLVSAFTALAAYFTGKSTEAAFERKIEILAAEQAGRTLSATQLQALIEHLRTIQRPTEPVHLMGQAGDREAIRLAHVLKQALKEAGIEVDGVWEDSLISGTGPGILIRQEKKEGVVGLGIAAALHQVGIDARIIELGSRAANKVEVIVGYKPFVSPGATEEVSA